MRKYGGPRVSDGWKIGANISNNLKWKNQTDYSPPCQRMQDDYSQCAAWLSSTYDQATWLLPQYFWKKEEDRHRSYMLKLEERHPILLSSITSMEIKSECKIGQLGMLFSYMFCCHIKIIVLTLQVHELIPSRQQFRYKYHVWCQICFSPRNNRTHVWCLAWCNVSKCAIFYLKATAQNNIFF